MGIKASAKVKFALIQEALMSGDNLLNVSTMCEIAGVSRSGYYNWCASEGKRQAREEQDRKDFELILEAYQHRGYDRGIEGIYMRLLHMNIRMNVKKIRRIARKYGLYCPTRKPNPYRQMAKALKTNNVSPNIVDRKFKRAPRKVLLTDITYLHYNVGVEKRTCYLSAILDAYTHEILAYQLSESLKVDFVIKTVNELIAKYGCTLDDETIVHSDQGSHYTSLQFIEKLKDANFVQSMSRKGNCWDNAPMESFFGHMKDDIKRIISKYNSYEEVVAKVDDWIDYYNNDRYQMDLEKLSPAEFYEYTQTGIYPLPVYNGKKVKE